jgi:hypothetical protein
VGWLKPKPDVQLCRDRSVGAGSGVLRRPMVNASLMAQYSCNIDYVLDVSLRRGGQIWLTVAESRLAEKTVVLPGA